MKYLGFNKVLCLSPHPDDVEYGVGGTILKYSNTQFDILCLTQGGDCDTTTNISRLEEARNAWGGTSNTNLFFTENKFLKEQASIDDVPGKIVDPPPPPPSGCPCDGTSGGPEDNGQGGFSPA